MNEDPKQRGGHPSHAPARLFGILWNLGFGSYLDLNALQVLVALMRILPYVCMYSQTGLTCQSINGTHRPYRRHCPRDLCLVPRQPIDPSFPFSLSRLKAEGPFFLAEPSCFPSIARSNAPIFSITTPSPLTKTRLSSSPPKCRLPQLL